MLIMLNIKMQKPS